MKRFFEATFYRPSRETEGGLHHPSSPSSLVPLVEAKNGHNGGLSETEVPHVFEKVDDERLVQAVTQAESHRMDLEAAKLEVARLIVEAAEMQTKMHLLLTQLQATEARATRAEGISLRCHQEFFVFQTKAVQQIKHLQDVIRMSQGTSEASNAGKKQALLDQSLIETMQRTIQKQELEREEEKQVMLQEMWDLQRIVESLQTKQEINEIARKEKEVLKVPLIDDRVSQIGKQEIPLMCKSPPVSVDRALPARRQESRSEFRFPFSLDRISSLGKQETPSGCRSPVPIPSCPRSPMSVSSHTSNNRPLGGVLSNLSKRSKDTDQVAIADQLRQNKGHADRKAQSLRAPIMVGNLRRLPSFTGDE